MEGEEEEEEAARPIGLLRARPTLMLKWRFVPRTSRLSRLNQTLVVGLHRQQRSCPRCSMSFGYCFCFTGYMCIVLHPISNLEINDASLSVLLPLFDIIPFSSAKIVYFSNSLPLCTGLDVLSYNILQSLLVALAL